MGTRKGIARTTCEGEARVPVGTRGTQKTSSLSCPMSRWRPITRPRPLGIFGSGRTQDSVRLMRRFLISGRYERWDSRVQRWIVVWSCFLLRVLITWRNRLERSHLGGLNKPVLPISKICFCFFQKISPIYLFIYSPLHKLFRNVPWHKIL